jgi:peptidoglycan hydrolase-like protein with peptidoglycan-binding domain
MSSRHTSVTVVLAALVLMGTSVGVGAWRYAVSRPTGPAAPSRDLPTARIVRTEVDQRDTIAGTLGYGAQLTIVHLGAEGVVTWLPVPGSTVGRGQPVYEVDGARTRLLFGDRPAWRSFAVGMPDGDDVLQLEQNLVALGYNGFTVDRSYTGATAEAVRRWQAALGLPHTGALPLGSVVFTPGPLRVAAGAVQVGGPIRTGEPVLRASSTARQVTAALPTAQRGQTAVGGTVYVTLPDGHRMTAKVTDIGRVAAFPSAPVGDTSAGSPQAALPVTITLDPVPAGTEDPTTNLDETPVQVTITAVRHPGVLAVPVTALASVADGYQVVVVDGGQRRPVPVRPGLLDEVTGLIEITGDQLTAGQLVEVPAT